jgi:hypothetical protein
MGIELKQIKVLLFLNIISLYIEALVPSFPKPLKTSSIKFFGLLSEPGGDFAFYSFIIGKCSVNGSRLEHGRAIRRMLEDFPLEISQRLICLVGSMGPRVVMQEEQGEYVEK